MTEIWKDVKGYEGLYQVSSCGRVKSLERHNYKNKHVLEKILKPCKDKKGYLMLTLYKDRKPHTKKVHLLVAQAFIPNHKNLPTINHKDENKENNFYSNLEWCSIFENNNYGTRNSRISESLSKPICQYDLSGVLIKQWKSSEEASKELGIDSSSIRKCCRGKQKTCGGYIWKSVKKGGV